MKKTLIALAAVGLVGSAFAQDSVTLYGQLSFDYTKTKKDSHLGVYSKAKQRAVAFSNYIGIRGVESISDNTNVVFKAEKYFWKSGADNREIYLGFENKNAGSLYFGRKDSLAKNQIDDYDLVGAEGYLVSGLTDAGRVDSSVTYVSPNFGGFQFALQTADKQDINVVNIDAKKLLNDPAYAKELANKVKFDENGVPHIETETVEAKKRYYAARLAYNYQGFSAAAAFTKNSAAGEKLLSQVGASYDFGSFKLAGTYENNKNFKKKNTFELMAGVPVNDQLAFAAILGHGYGHKETRFGVVSTYALSKRTVLFGGVAYAKVKKENDKPLWGGKKSKDHQITVGALHKF